MANFKDMAGGAGGTPGMRLREVMEKITTEKDPEKKKALQEEARTLREGMGRTKGK